MGIENDIQQFTFLSAKQKATINILYTYGWIIERIKVFLTPEGITHQQYNILRILKGSYPKPLSTLQIRERMLDKMSDTSRIVDRLVTKKLVTKAISPKDRRLVDVIITQKGQEVLSKLDVAGSFVDNIMNNLTEEEAEQLSALLDKIRNSNSEE